MLCSKPWSVKLKIPLYGSIIPFVNDYPHRRRPALNPRDARHKSVKDRLPNLLSSDAYRNIEAQLQVSQYEKEWKEGRSLEQILQEVNDFIRLRGRHPAILEVREALEKAIRAEQETSAPRMRAAQDDMVRIASMESVPEKYQPLGGGFYREGHSVWELRASEDDAGGYVLVRKREERAVDMKRHSSLLPPIEELSDSERVQLMRSPFMLKAGEKVSFCHHGQALPVVVLETPNDADSHARVQDESGHELVVPIELLVIDMLSPEDDEYDDAGVTNILPECQCSPLSDDSECDQLAVAKTVGPAGCSCQCHAQHDDSVRHGLEQALPFREVSTSDLKTAAIRRAFVARSLNAGFDVANLWGRWVTPTKTFSPQYMSGQFQFSSEDRDVYEVEGSSRADPSMDRMYKVPNPVLPYPNARPGAEWALNDRVRLVPEGGGAPIFVSPMELEKYFTIAPFDRSPTDPRGDLDPVMDMPGEPAMRPDIEHPDLNEIPTEYPVPSLVPESEAPITGYEKTLISRPRITPSTSIERGRSRDKTQVSRRFDPNKTPVIKQGPTPSQVGVSIPVEKQPKRQPTPRQPGEWGRPFSPGESTKDVPAPSVPGTPKKPTSR